MSLTHHAKHRVLFRRGFWSLVLATPRNAVWFGGIGHGEDATQASMSGGLKSQRQQRSTCTLNNVGERIKTVPEKDSSTREGLTTKRSAYLPPEGKARDRPNRLNLLSEAMKPLKERTFPSHPRTLFDQEWAIQDTDTRDTGHQDRVTWERERRRSLSRLTSCARQRSMQVTRLSSIMSARVGG